jgi:hypothetical protein
MTRLQVIQALAQGLALPSGDPKALSRLRDGATVPAQVQPQVAAAIASKLLVNYPDRTALTPTRPITRAELAVMLYQALLRTGRTGTIASPYLAI